MDAVPTPHNPAADMEARARAPPPSTSVVTCVACRVRLHGPDTRRAHYLSDWHRANIKRKLAGLPPLTPDEYTRRVEALAAASGGGDGAGRGDGGGDGRASAGRGGLGGQGGDPASGVVMTPSGAFCGVCSKRFSSAKAAENHLSSRRHIDKARSLADGAAAAGEAGSAVQPSAGGGGDADVGAASDSDDADAMELEARIADGGTAFPPTTCVFDGKACGTVPATLDHMAATHGFFMPYVELLVDAAGLLTYLGEKVGLGYACVACDRPFASVEAVQKHMVDKAHMRMVDDDERWVDEYAPFFSVDADDHAGGDGDGEGADAEEGGEWEEVEDDAEAAELLEEAGLSAAATATSGAASLAPTASGGASRSTSRQVVAAAAADAAPPPLQGGADVGEVMDKITSSLVLPSGRVLGHRDLARYYKQRPSPAADARAVARASTRSAVLSSYKRLGWAGPTVSRAAAADQRLQLLRFKRDHLRVGVANYYTRKAAVRPKLGVLNSGYRP